MSKIQSALNSAMRDIASIGIGKTQKNESQGYRFRGVEQAMNELSPIMVNHGITVTPSYSELSIAERSNAKGTVMRFATIKGAFTFTAEDDTHVTSEAYGEAMDSGDKAVIKAQSVAFRTALFQLFVVPTMSMDTELEGGQDDTAGESDLLDTFQAASMKGTVALRKHYEAHTPPEAFWKRNSASLKAAAAQADKDGQRAAA